MVTIIFRAFTENAYKLKHAWRTLHGIFSLKMKRIEQLFLKLEPKYKDFWIAPRICTVT